MGGWIRCGWISRLLGRPDFQSRGPKLPILNGERKKPINIKNFGGTPPGVRPVCPGDTSHLSRDMSPSVPGTFCPFCIDSHINQAQMSQVSLGRPEFVPGTPPGHPTAKFLYVAFLYRFFSLHIAESAHCRRAKTGRFGSLAFAMKNRHFGGECSWILAGKARKCGRFWVFACVPNPGKQSIWRQCPPSGRKQSTKKLPNRPGFAHVHLPIFGIPSFGHPQLRTSLSSESLTSESLALGISLVLLFLGYWFL